MLWWAYTQDVNLVMVGIYTRCKSCYGGHIHKIGGGGGGGGTNSEDL